ncbi:unnamed protein product [Mortierella alpina]
MSLISPASYYDRFTPPSKNTACSGSIDTPEKSSSVNSPTKPQLTSVNRIKSATFNSSYTSSIFTQNDNGTQDLRYLLSRY